MAPSSTVRLAFSTSAVSMSSVERSSAAMRSRPTIVLVRSRSASWYSARIETGSASVVAALAPVADLPAPASTGPRSTTARPPGRPSRLQAQTPATMGCRRIRAAVSVPPRSRRDSLPDVRRGHLRLERQACRANHAEVGNHRLARRARRQVRLRTTPAGPRPSSRRRNRQSGLRSPGSSLPVPAQPIPLARYSGSTSRAASCAPCAPATSTCLPTRRGAVPPRCARSPRRRAARTRRGTRREAGRSPARGRCG